MPGVIGAILVGGKSRRMGRPKHAVEIDGTPMLEHVADALGEVCDAIVLLGDAPDLPDEYERIEDLRPGEGPLAGIEALLASGRGDAYVVCSCDMPRLTGDLVRRLVQPCAGKAHVFRLPGAERPEPFPMWLSHATLPIVRERLDQDERSMRGFLEAAGASIVDLNEHDASFLENVNRL